MLQEVGLQNDSVISHDLLGNIIAELDFRVPHEYISGFECRSSSSPQPRADERFRAALKFSSSGIRSTLETNRLLRKTALSRKPAVGKHASVIVITYGVVEAAWQGGAGERDHLVKLLRLRIKANSME
jgi:hypothetical protein